MFHSCLVVKYHDESEETEILGLGYQEAWVRPEKKSKADKGKESEIWLRTLEKMGRPQANWVSVGDRANDIYNFLHNGNRLGWNFIVRARHDRKVEVEGEQTHLFSWIRQQTAKCTSKLYVKAKGEEFSGEITLEITWAKAKLFAPGNTDAEACEEVTYIRVWCSEKPDLEWLLITNLAVNSEKDALRIVKIYRRRWLIEDYHKAVKTGFRIEDNQLKQASRIFALFGMVAVIATKLLAMREHCRLFPTTPVEKEIPERWITLVERYLRVKLKTVRDFWRALARMGGFIGRKSDREPGWQTIWKGYKRLQDMLLGANLL
jgi:FMN phosphatase YigB (HAD superfamily)